jgi:metal-responsive CopG/Arc/MetJ family transcriptional regulator
MSKSLSLTIEDADMRAVDDAAKELHVGREAFITQAIRKYAKAISARRHRNQLQNESKMTAAESLTVLKEFEAIS